MKCKHIENKIIFYIEGSLQEKEESDIKKHIENCKSCYNIYNQMKLSLAVIDNEKDKIPNPFLYTRIKQNIDDLENTNKNFIFSPKNKMALQSAFATFFLAVGIFAGVFLGNTLSNDIKISDQISETEELYFNEMEFEEIETTLLSDLE